LACSSARSARPRDDIGDLAVAEAVAAQLDEVNIRKTYPRARRW
jgi:hypothetical protein